MTSKHAKFAPSSLSRLLACPGSYRHNLKRPDETTEYASEGHRAHALAEEILRGGAPSEPKAPGVPTEMSQSIGEYVEYVRGLGSVLTTLLVEQRVEVVPGLIYGTADAIVYEPFGRLHVVDLKYGAGIRVNPVGNPQLAAYALGAILELGKQGIEFESLEIHIAQPRVEDGFGSWVIEDVEGFVKEWGSKFADMIVACEAPDAPFQTGEHCRFCLGRVGCPLMQEEASTTALSAEMNTDLVGATVEQLIYFKEREETVKMFLRAVDKELLTRAERGEDVPGFKIVDRLSNRKWTLSDDEMVAKLRNCKHKLGQRDSCDLKLKSPAQIEKLIGGTEGKKLVAKYTDREITGRKLAPLSAKDRKALVSTVAEFGDVTKE